MKDEGRGTRVFYIPPAPGCARFSSASLRPSAHSLCRPGGLCFSQAPAFSAIQPANPACPGVAERSLRCPVASPLRRLRRRRYNTLDLAGKIVCQGRPCPLWIPLPRNRPVSLDASPQRKPEHPNCAPAFSAQRGASPLDSLCKRNAVPHRSPCQRHRESVSLGVSLGENCYEPQDAHNSFPIT